MSFSIRPTFKPRNLAIVLGSSSDQQNGLADQEEAQEIITAIKKFGQKSSHENLISSGDLQNLLRSSSINPEVNPQARRGVESLIKSKKSGPAAEEKKATDAHGFSSTSVDKFHDGQRVARLDKELSKELEQIRARARKNRGDYDDRDIPDDIALQISAMRSSSEAVEENEDSELEINADETDETKKSRASIEKAKRALAFGYPISASMARGYYRQGGHIGQGIKRTALGVSDAF